MFKRISLIVVLVLTAVLTACQPTQEELTDLEKLSNIKKTIEFTETELTDDIVIPTISEEGVTAVWSSSNEKYLTASGEVTRPDYTVGNRSITLTLTLTLNETVSYANFSFVILSEEAPDVVELNTDATDALVLDFAYEGFDFIDDGVGEVSLVSCIDGDTAVFNQGGDNFTVRFLGIDTPESTAKFEPWGKAASAFTCEKLTNAETIVLQSDPASGRLDSYNTRYLSWVWYDGRLLNLELVELAYSKAESAIGTYYYEDIFNVGRVVMFSDRRVWGEEDPDFDYSLEGVQLTIEELVTNFAEYESKKVAITGVISATVGNSVYIQQGDYGIFVYVRNYSPHLVVGNEVLLSGLTATQYPSDGTGSIQCSGYQALEQYSKVLSQNNSVTPVTYSVNELTTDQIGSFLRLENLTVTNFYEANGAFTITAQDEFGNQISIRKDDDTNLGSLTSADFAEGTIFTIEAPLSRYQSNLQLMLTDEENILFNNN